MMRLVAAVLVLVVAGFPLAVYAAAPVTWLSLGALAVAATGVALLSVPLVTAGATLALVAEAAALLIARTPVDPVGAIVLGVALTLLLSVVHFAARVDGAWLGPSLVAVQVRQWLIVSGLGVIAAAALAAVAGALAGAFRGVGLPAVIAAAALGAALTLAGVVALLTRRHATPGKSAR